MAYVEIEVRAKTLDLAIEAAMQELGVENRDQISVDVIQEPERGFLGIGGQDAVVRVKKRRPRRRRGRGKNREQSQRSGKHARHEGGRSAKNEKSRQPNQRKGKERDGKGKERDVSRHESKDKPKADDRPVVSIDEQATIVREFLEGLVTAYGLEGSVTTEVSDEVIVADVSGEQTEALVGVRGSVRSSIHELTRTVLQRYAQDTARLRLDIAGYAERRRQALMIYAEQLIEQLRQEGGEIMLEPMSPADRKVIHDAAAAEDDVESYSEGESPRRYVVLRLTSGAEPASTEEE